MVALIFFLSSACCLWNVPLVTVLSLLLDLAAILAWASPLVTIVSRLWWKNQQICAMKKKHEFCADLHHTLKLKSISNIFLWNQIYIYKYNFHSMHSKINKKYTAILCKKNLITKNISEKSHIIIIILILYYIYCYIILTELLSLHLLLRNSVMIPSLPWNCFLHILDHLLLLPHELGIPNLHSVYLRLHGTNFSLTYFWVNSCSSFPS